MPSQWSFFPIVVDNPDFAMIDSFFLESSEVYILWALGGEGPTNASQLSNDQKVFPLPSEAINSIQISRHIVLEIVCFDKKTIIESFERLEKKGLIETFYISDNRKIATLTFHGIIWYLRNFWHEYAFNKIFSSASGSCKS